MNAETSAEQNVIKTNIDLQADKSEVCDHCNHERGELTSELDQQTLNAQDPNERQRFIAAHLAKLEINNPELAATVVIEYETQRRKSEPAFDITTLPPQRLDRIIGRASNLDAQKGETTDLKQSRNDYRSKVESLNTTGQSNVEIIKSLITDPATPESERTKLTKFAQLIDMAEAPEDQVLMTEKIDMLDLGRLPEPKAFIAFQVFDSPEHRTGFSEAFQEEVAKAYDITRPPKVVAHSDVRKVAQHTTSVVDPKTGEITEQFIHDSEENMAEFRPGVGTYMNGNRVMLKSIAGEMTKDVTGLSDTAIGHMAEAMSFHAALDYFDATGFVETIGGFKFNSLTGDSFSPTKIQIIRKTMSALTGMSEGHDGAVFDARTKMPLIRKQMEFLSPTGNLSGWRQNPEAAKAKLEALGLHVKGQPNFDKIEKFINSKKAKMRKTQIEYST